MGYDSKSLNLSSQPPGAGPRQWDYGDTGGETAGNYAGAGFFADAKDKGVKVGDRVTVRDLSGAIQYAARFSAVQDTGGTTGTIVLDTG